MINKTYSASIYAAGLFLLFTCFAGFLQAQPVKGMTRAAFKAATLRQVPRVTAESIAGRGSKAVTVDLAKQLGQFHEKAFQARFKGGLPAQQYGILAEQDKRQRLVEYFGTLKNHDFLTSRLVQIANRVQSRVFKGDVPYTWFIPKDSRLIVVGETHYEEALQYEFLSLVVQYSTQYPDRRIYVASEFLPDLFVDEPFHPAHLIRRAEQMQSAPGLNPDYWGPLKLLLGEDVVLFGLEPNEMLRKMALRPGQTEVTEAQREELGTSLSGVRLRNQHWARRIKELRAYDPQGIIFVYAGLGHTGYHEPFSLSKMLRPMRPFSIQLNIPEGLPITNPLFMHLREDANTRAGFNAAQDHKLLESWKPYTRASYKELLGFDLTVLVHSGNWKPSPLAEGLSVEEKILQAETDLSSSGK